MTRSGYIAVVGRANVGKSTLINRLIGQKITITSRKPQTTRHALIGIHSEGETQFVFIDTPGIHSDGKKAINRQMNRTAWQSIAHVAAVIQVSESERFTEEDRKIAAGIGTRAAAKIHVVNKIDRLKDKTALLAVLEQRRQLGDWQEIVPVSALKGQNLDLLLRALTPYLPERPWLFPADQITTAGMRFMAAEIIREKLFRYLHREIPYALGVLIEGYSETNAMVHIDALILVERDSHKGIVIGTGGKTLKAVGKAAREELEGMLERKVMLRHFVKVKGNWRDNERIIHSMGSGNAGGFPR